MSAYADDVIVFVNNQEEVDILRITIDDFGKLSSAKVNWTKSEAIVCGKWEGKCLPNLPAGLEWKKNGFKYLGVYLGHYSILQKNWEGVLEKTKGRLEKWKWLWSKLSFRGRIIVINNLVASTFWHRLACTEPPSGLLAKQALIVDFFWTKFHWVPQNVLYLPKEEGGQGLVHLASRGATFRLQFIQRFLTGPEDLVWRNVANFILSQVGGLGLDSALFLMDSSKIQLNGLTPFYKGVFRIWSLFKKRRGGFGMSLYWLLEEPTVFGARFDVSSEVAWGFEKCNVQSKKS